MEVHLLNGDALAEKFPLPGEIVICRECMMDGPSNENDQSLFWKQRAEFIVGTFKSSREEYDRYVTHEFDKLKRLQPDEINLWFEHDLFCQAKLWFCLNFVSTHIPTASVYIAMPDPNSDPQWSGFGNMNSTQLTNCYKRRVCVHAAEKQLAMQLWDAFRTKDRLALSELSSSDSLCFPQLREVCQAELDRNPITGMGRPHLKLQSILNAGETDFAAIFDKFRETEGVYGYGDLQVKELLSTLTSSASA